jgi:3-hydroxyacyl-[acyl-carrier-protein] dehydratase
MVANTRRGLKQSPAQDLSMTTTHTAEPVVSPSELLAMVLPCGAQFLFLDEILEADQAHLVARYRFRKDSFFYSGHFPECPITPGTILLEAMIQCGMTAQGYYLLAQETGKENARRHRFLALKSEVEWFEPVPPDTLVTMRSQLLAWKFRHIRASVKMFNENDDLVAESLVSGTGVLLISAGEHMNSSDKSPECEGSITKGVPYES